VFEEQAPDNVDPSTDDRYEDTEYQTKDVGDSCLLKDRGNTDDNFDDPVDARNEQKQDLKKSRLFIEPLHFV
jgi:hypothetical protein